MKITLNFELGDNEFPLQMAKNIEKLVQEAYTRRLVREAGKDAYVNDARKVTVIHFEV
jgi:hypothetical protein